MDDEMITQLRSAAFSEERRGFSKTEVRGFLDEIAKWVEGGGGETVRRRLERIAHKSATILADAEAGAEDLRRDAEGEARARVEQARAEAEACREEAEEEARGMVREARIEANSTRESADEYAAETRTGADSYAAQTRGEAKRESEELGQRSAEKAAQIEQTAEQRAEEIVAAANRRRDSIETVIRDLAAKRNSAIAEVRKLTEELTAVVGELGVASAEVGSLDEARKQRSEDRVATK